jgi:Tat protein translocase TatB subunit
VFGIGATELVLILAVALIVVGPKRLPGLAQSLGRSMAEFRRHSNDLRRSIQEADISEDLKRAASSDSYRIAPPDLEQTDPSSTPETSALKDGTEATPNDEPRKPLKDEGHEPGGG